MSLPYNPRTELTIIQLRKYLPHGVLLSGEQGVGLEQAALDIADRQLAEVIRPTTSEGVVDGAKGVIRIEQIRSLYEATRGKSKHRRIYIITKAETMGEPAQNALLKLLEEPTLHVHFILTSHHPMKLLPTILSRLQKVRIDMLESDQSKQLLMERGITDSTLLQQLLFLANGRPALLDELASNTKLRSERIKYMSDARTFLQGAVADRLRILHDYGGDRSQSLQLIESALAIIKHSLSQKPSVSQLQLANSLVSAYDSIAANGSAKLNLMLIVV